MNPRTLQRDDKSLVPVLYMAMEILSSWRDRARVGTETDAGWELGTSGNPGRIGDQRGVRLARSDTDIAWRADVHQSATIGPSVGVGTDV